MTGRRAEASHHPVLSICVPSRNRQRYMLSLATALLNSPRTDIQIVIADNSDDGTIVSEVLAPIISDPRLTFLPSTGTTLSMMDNWERCVAATTGRWISVIGDDDHLDPDVATVIRKLEQTMPDVDALGWGRFTWNWPGARPHEGNVTVSLDTGILRFRRETLIRRMFGWEGATMVPDCPFSIYHGAVRRDLLDRIRRLGKGKVFEHPTVDYDSSFKILQLAQGFAFLQRPFSVLGCCPESNSASIGRLEDTKAKHAAFMADLGRDMDQDPDMRDFPFKSWLGVTASIAMAQHWFKKTYKLEIPNWEENFARACAVTCQKSVDEATFLTTRDAFNAAFAAWKGGRFLPAFEPVYRNIAWASVFTGVRDRLLYLHEDIAGVQNPAELYAVVDAMLVGAEDIVVGV